MDRQVRIPTVRVHWLVLTFLTVLACTRGHSGAMNDLSNDDASVWAEDTTELTSTTLPATMPVSDPEFEITPSEVRVAAGTSAYLTCAPRSLRNKTVSWIRWKDLSIVAVGRYTYTKDSRFSVYHQRHTGEWTLQLKSTAPKDSGLYECQIGTQPTRSYFVNLQVVEPTTSIYGGPDIHVHEGSPVNLSCVVLQAVGQPEFFFWYHNGQVVEFGGGRTEVRQYFSGTDVTVSSLLIRAAQLTDSGNYTCQPAHCPPVSARIFILKGEQPAAMQRSGSALMMNAPGSWSRLLVVAVATCYSSYSLGLLSLPLSIIIFLSIFALPVFIV